MMMMMIIIIIIIIILIIVQGNRGKVRQQTLLWPCTVPNSVETSHDFKDQILWDQQVRTDRTIPNYKSDIIIGDNKKEHAS